MKEYVSVCLCVLECAGVFLCMYVCVLFMCVVCMFLGVCGVSIGVYVCVYVCMNVCMGV